MTVAVQVAVGVKVCSREEPEVPHPLQAQVPPEVGSGLRVTWVPVVAATLAVWVLAPLTEVKGVIAVALQTAVGGGTGVGAGVEEDPPPPHPARAMSTAVAARFVSRRRAGEWVFIEGFVPAREIASKRMRQGSNGSGYASRIIVRGEPGTMWDFGRDMRDLHGSDWGTLSENCFYYWLLPSGPRLRRGLEPMSPSIPSYT
jgi:hypothetical protein